MKFKNTPPIWEETGVEPTEELQKKGFLAGYKPPAAYFNYLFNRIVTCIKEVQTNLSNVENTADIDKPTSKAQQESINAMLISGTGYGKNVCTPNSADAPFNAFVLYGASNQSEPPTLDNPKVIKSVGDNGSLAVRITRKNLFQPATGTANGVTLSKIDDYYVLNGTCTESHNFVLSLPYELEAGTYTISANNPKNNGIEFHLIDVHSSSLNETLGVYDNTNYNKKTKQLTGGRYSCRVRIEKGVTYDNFIFKPQLERSDVATSYEPYTETVATLPLTVPLYGIPVASGGNYTDKNEQQWLCDEIDAMRGVYVQRLSTVDLSTLAWSVAMNWWQATIDNMQYAASNIEYGVAMAECYRLRLASGMTTADHGEFAIDVNNIKVDNGSSTEKPEGLLVYKLAEPKETPLTIGQLTILSDLRSYEGQSNISTNDIGDLSLEYFKNTDNGKAASVLKTASELGTDEALHKANVNQKTLGYSCKNLLPYPHFGTTQVSNGITWTDNGDGTVTANGTATANSAYFLQRGFNLVDGETYTINGCPANGGTDTWLFRVADDTNTANIMASDYGAGRTFTYDEDSGELRVYLRITAGVTVSNLTFAPMIRLASDTDATYEPYRENVDTRLTDIVKCVTKTAAIASVVSPNVVTAQFALNETGYKCIGVTDIHSLDSDGALTHDRYLRAKITDETENVVTLTIDDYAFTGASSIVSSYEATFLLIKK